MPRVIKRFQGEYRFLSNFYPSKITWGDWYYRTVEHFFQAMKSRNEADHAMIIRRKSPGEAKRMGRLIRMRRDWEEVKENIMERGLELKFSQHPELADKLLATRNAIFEEGNTWHDTYWGKDIVTGLGENRLGILLMKERDRIRRQRLCNDIRKVMRRIVGDS